MGNGEKERQNRVIAFDLDGTLLRGVEFSWILVWKYLGFPDTVRKEGMERYMVGEITYQEWCDWACEQFRLGGLKREDFAEITASVTVTKNLHETINVLKNEGFVPGIISGGMDTFLYEKIPDADDLFDYIFINKLSFDSEGIISGVTTTPYDFGGKVLGLEKMCADHGTTIIQAVFVGDGPNDNEVAARAGLSIAYPPKPQGMRATVEIAEDDLSLIVPYVLRL